MSTKQRWKPLLVAAAAAMTLALTSCASSSTAASSPAAGSGAGIEVGMVGLYNLPYISSASAGSAAAAQQAGATYTRYGPQGLDPNKAIADFQNALAAGKKGMLVFAYPGDLWAAPLNRAIGQGATIATTDVFSATSKVTTHTGAPKVAMGAALADAYLKQIPATATGQIVPGICVPGLDALVAPLRGFKARIESERPGVKVIDAETTSGDPASNFAAWQRIEAKYPKAIGFVGLCDQDVPNLIKIKQTNPNAAFLTGVTAGGDDPAAINALKTGLMVGVISQRPWVQGYVGMSFILNHLLHNAPMPAGWVNTGYEVITKDNLAVMAGVVSDPAAAQKYYTPLAASLIKDGPAKAHQPLTYVFDPASINEPNPQASAAK